MKGVLYTNDRPLPAILDVGEPISLDSNTGLADSVKPCGIWENSILLDLGIEDQETVIGVFAHRAKFYDLTNRRFVWIFDDERAALKPLTEG